MVTGEQGGCGALVTFRKCDPRTQTIRDAKIMVRSLHYSKRSRNSMVNLLTRRKKKNWKWETLEEIGIIEIKDKTSDIEGQNQVSKNEV